MGLETEDEFVSMKQGMEDRREEEEEDVYSFLLSAPALKPLGICTLLMVFQQFSGINAVMFYSVSIFVASGSPSPHASTIILGIVNIAATIISNLLIDRLGRKVARMQNVKSRPQRDLTVAWQVLLQLSCVGMIVSLGLLGFHYHSDETSPATPLVALMVNLSPRCTSGSKTIFQVYIVSFSLGFGPIPWLLMGELLPSRARGPCAAFATGSKNKHI